MKKIRCIVVENEEAPLIEIVTLIKTLSPEIEIIAECRSYHEAVEKINALEPDLVFFDIDLGENKTAFNVLKKVKERNFIYFFLTGYDHFHQTAMQFSAIDYLRKPMDSQKFLFALHKFYSVSNELLRKEIEDQEIRLQALFSNISTHNLLFTKYIIEMNEGVRIIDADNIIRFEGRDDICTIVFFEGKVIHRALSTKSLGNEEKLFSTSRGFVKVHKSHLINTKHFKSSVKNIPFIIMADNERIPVSDTGRTLLRKVLPKL